MRIFGLIFLLWCELSSGSFTVYRILVFLPTSGPEPNALRSKAVKAGINIAFKEHVANLNLANGVQVDIAYYDTQCNAALEQKRLLQELSGPQVLSRFIVFSYDCENGLVATQCTPSPRPDYSPVDIPQVHLEGMHEGSLVINGGRSLLGMLQTVVDFIVRQKWRTIGLLHHCGPDAPHVPVVNYITRKLVKEEIRLKVQSFHPKTNLCTQRIWIVIGDPEEIAQTLCHFERKSTAGRYVWIIPVAPAQERILANAISNICGGLNSGSLLLFQANISTLKVPNYFTAKLIKENIGTPDEDLKTRAAHAYDISHHLFTHLNTVIQRANFRSTFGEDLFSELINASPTAGITGPIELDKEGIATSPPTPYIYKGNSFRISRTIAEYVGMGDSEVRTETRLEGVPLWMFVVLSALALLGIIYAIIILVFNVIKAKTKVVKMTSPNINIIILLGVITGFGSIPMGGLDSGIVSENTMETLQRSITFVIPISFTVIYGALFAKSWRVFLVFKNLNFNGKLTRDEHLLVGVLVMIVLDLTILLPWILVDPVTCERKTFSIEEKEDTQIIYEIDECRSKLQELWISLLYFYKILLVLAGLYFTWQTRHVTLPSLRDSAQTYVVVFTVISLAFVALPSLLVPSIGMHIRFATGGLAIWIVLTTTLTLLFMPKMILEHKTRAASENASAFNFLFSESMRKTQEAIRKCSLCFCCGATEADRYGQEMLASEIDTLKRTIKQKDATIRELNDRLYIGTEKFHEYLTSPMKQTRSVLQAMQDKHLSRTQSRETSQNHKHENDRSVVTTVPRKAHISELSSDAAVDDEGIHSCESYQQSSGEHSPDSNRLPICLDQPSNAIQTVSNGHIMSEQSHASSMRSYMDSRSSFSSQRSVRSFRDRYNGEPWRPPSPDEDPYHRNPLPRHSSQRDVNRHQQQSNVFNQPYRVSGREMGNGNATWTQTRRDNPHRYSGRSLPDRRSYPDHRVQRNHIQSQQFSQIDLGAMEHDAVSHATRTPSSGRHQYYGQGDGYSHDLYRSSHSIAMSVSQI